MTTFTLGPVTMTLECGHHHWRLVPGFRDLREQKIPAVPTPHFHGHRAKELLAMFQMTDAQQVTITIAFADSRGNPTGPPAGGTTPAWSTDNTELLALTPAPDGMSCVVGAVGPLGSGAVSVKVADAGGNPLASGALKFEIIGGAPVNIILTPGTPTPLP